MTFHKNEKVILDLIKKQFTEIVPEVYQFLKREDVLTIFSRDQFIYTVFQIKECLLFRFDKFAYSRIFFYKKTVTYPSL